MKLWKAFMFIMNHGRGRFGLVKKIHDRRDFTHPSYWASYYDMYIGAIEEAIKEGIDNNSISQQELADARLQIKKLENDKLRLIRRWGGAGAVIW